MEPRKFMFNGYNYHIVTLCDENGMDERPEVKTLSQAREAADWYLETGYTKVFVLTDKKVVIVYDQHHRSGRPVYERELTDFTFMPERKQPVQLSLF